MISELTSLVPGILYVFDLRQQRTVFVNRQVARVLGHDELDVEEPGAGLFSRLLHPDDRPALDEQLESMSTLPDGMSRQVEYRLRHADGSWRWFESREAVLRRDADGHVLEVIGMASDITERKENELSLRVLADQHRFRAALADALRRVGEPIEVQSVAAQLLGEQLAATRVHYADVTEEGSAAVVQAEYCDGVPGVVGSHDLSRYGPAVMDEVRAGKTVAVSDVDQDPRIDPAQRAALRELAVRAWVISPLLRAGRPMALLVVHQGEPREWTAAEIEIIEETAERTRATVEGARALAALAEREARYRSLFSSIDEGFCLCEIITDQSGDPIDYRFLEVNARFEEQTGLVAPVGRTAREMIPELEPGWVRTMARVGLGGESLRYEDRVESLNRWFDVFAAPVEPIGGGRFLVVVNDVSERREAEASLRSSASAARRGRARAELAASVMSQIEAIDRPQALAEALVQTLVPRLADYALLEVPGREEPVLAATHRDETMLPVVRALRDPGRPVGSQLSILRAVGGDAQLIAEVTPAMLDDLAGDADRTAALLKQLGPRSHVAVPVDVGGDAGALLLGLSRPERRPYGHEELALAQEIGRRVGVLFAHARVREEEHLIGVRLQRALLPVVLLEHPAVQVAARYQTASDLHYVGGDWYDTLALPDGRIAFAVGDVVGHGLDAAAAMSRLRIGLAALAADAPGPGALLYRLSEFAAGADGVEFATALCGFLDPATGQLQYASAGHPPVLVVSPDGLMRWLDGGRSMPVGRVSPLAPRPQASCHLGPGDLLILYSDGLIERRREAITVGLGRLQAAARPLVDLPVEEICERLLASMTTPSTSDDDAVVLCLRYGRVATDAFQRRMPARPDELSRTRQAIRSWLRAAEHRSGAESRLLLAVGEALTNAVEHAYRDTPPGAIDLSIIDGGDRLQVEVRDHGHWRTNTGEPDRGRGLAVITTLTEDFQRRTGTGGTTLSFRLPLNGAAG